MLETMSLRMVHLSRLAFEASSGERHCPRPIHRSGRETSRGRRSGGAAGVDEAGDPGDLAVPQAQHVDRAQPEPLPVVLVAGERRLPVRRDRHQPPRRGEHPLGQEPADVLATVEPRGQRRHREPGVLSQQVEQNREAPWIRARSGALEAPEVEASVDLVPRQERGGVAFRGRSAPGVLRHRLPGWRTCH